MSTVFSFLFLSADNEGRADAVAVAPVAELIVAMLAIIDSLSPLKVTSALQCIYR
jgi:hypothetical protein